MRDVQNQLRNLISTENPKSGKRGDRNIFKYSVMGSPQYDNEILRYNVFVRSINGESDLEIFKSERGRIVKIERVDKTSVKESDDFLGDSTLSKEIQELEFQRDNFLI